MSTKCFRTYLGWKFSSSIPIRFVYSFSRFRYSYWLCSVSIYLSKRSSIQFMVIFMLYIWSTRRIHLSKFISWNLGILEIHFSECFIWSNCAEIFMFLVVQGEVWYWSSCTPVFCYPTWIEKVINAPPHVRLVHIVD